MKTFELTPQELDSALWKKLEGHFKGRLAMYRRQNDSMQGIEETSKLRGKIAATKELLGLNPAMETTDREAGGV